MKNNPIYKAMMEINIEEVQSRLRSKLLVADIYLHLPEGISTTESTINSLMTDIYKLNSEIGTYAEKCYAYNYQDILAEINQIDYVCRDYLYKLRKLAK